MAGFQLSINGRFWVSTEAMNTTSVPALLRKQIDRWSKTSLKAE